MNDPDTRREPNTENVPISSNIKKRLQDYCRREKRPFRQTLDEAIYRYIQDRLRDE